jgi:hypothetical protein
MIAVLSLAGTTASPRLMIFFQKVGFFGEDYAANQSDTDYEQ